MRLFSAQSASRPRQLLGVLAVHLLVAFHAFADCTTNRLHWTRLSPNPPERYGHAMVYDDHRNRTILFGGSTFGVQFYSNAANTNLADTWEYDGAMWVKRNVSGPRARDNHALAFDSRRQRTVLFGGYYHFNGDRFLADTWEYDGLEWVRNTAPGPPARFGHTMVFESDRNRIVLFGGRRLDASTGSFVELDDTWEYDGVAWSQIAVPGPEPRFSHSMTYDPIRNRTFLFGGRGNNSVLGDTWEYDGTAWAQRSVPGPPARFGAAVAFDLASQRMLLISGADATNYLPDTWEFDGTAWTLRSQSGPFARTGAAASYDPLLRKTLLFAGFHRDTQGRISSDLWTYSNAAWSELNAIPAPRQQPHLSFDIDRGRVVMVGGSTTSGTTLTDTWEYGAGGWKRILASGPSLAAAVYDENLRRVMGISLEQFFPYVPTKAWSYDGTAWTQLPITPPTIAGRVMVHDRTRARSILFGSDTTYWVKEFDGVAWINAPSNNSLTPFGTVAYDSARQRTVLCHHGTKEFNGVDWNTISSAPTPGNRTDHAIAYHAGRQRTTLFGGTVLSGGDQSDAWEFDGVSWVPLQSCGPPHPTFRSRHAMVYDPVHSRVLMFGGRQLLNAVDFSELWSLSDQLIMLAQSDDRRSTRGAYVDLSVVPDVSLPATYQWRKNGVPLTDDGVLRGSNQNVLQILAMRTTDFDLYDCVITDAVGSVTSTPVRISCVADFNLDGDLSVQDIFDFLNAWLATDPRADFNGADGLQVQDIFDYLNAWLNGC